MFRRILHASLLTLCLLLTLAFTTGALFPINLGPYPAGYRDRSVATFFIQSYNRSFEIYFLTHPLTPRSPGTALTFRNAGQDVEFRTLVLHWGFHYQHLDYVRNATNRVTLRGHGFTIPDWMLALLMFTLTIPLALPHLRHLRRRLRPDPNSCPCPTCHYDLRAHHPGDKCPEYGRLIDVSAEFKS